MLLEYTNLLFLIVFFHTYEVSCFLVASKSLICSHLLVVGIIRKFKNPFLRIRTLKIHVYLYELSLTQSTTSPLGFVNFYIKRRTEQSKSLQQNRNLSAVYIFFICSLITILVCLNFSIRSLFSPSVYNRRDLFQHKTISFSNRLNFAVG